MIKMIFLVINGDEYHGDWVTGMRQGYGHITETSQARSHYVYSGTFNHFFPFSIQGSWPFQFLHHSSHL